MNEVNIQEDRETGLCDRCKKESNLHSYWGEMLCSDCRNDEEGYSI